MIPTLLIAGLVFGRWWRVTIPVAAIGWAALLLATDVGSGPEFAAGATLLGLVNVTLGVMVFQAARLVAQRVARGRA